MDLEKIRDYNKVDKSNMLRILLSLPEDIKRAYDSSKELAIPSEVRVGRVSISYSNPSDIVICGMGGSAIGGDLLRCLAMDQIPLHIEVVRDYTLPTYADKNTLAIVISYSGNTEEALSCFIQAIKRGCMTIAISSGGKLGEYAEKMRIPIYRAPAGRPPRTAIAYLFIPLINILQKIGIDLKVNIKECIDILKKIREEVRPERPIEENLAKKLAQRINGFIPAIYAYRSYYAVAFRFKTQLNENSKYPAKVEEMPELNHNEIVGWGIDGDLTKRFIIIMLRGGDEPEEINIRFEITKELIQGKVKDVIELYGRGEERLSRMLSLLYIGDFTSYYLALINDINPTPVPSIIELKRKLSERGKALMRIEAEYRTLLSGY